MATPALPLIKALVEPVRIRLYLLLKKAPLTVSELSEILELSQSNTSHHVKALRELGLLTAEKTGQHTYYGLSPETMQSDRIAGILKSLAGLSDEIPEAKSDDTKLNTVLAARREDTFALWRLEQPDLPYSDIFAHLTCGRRGLVADIGCGEGDFFERLSLSFERVIGIDIEVRHTLQAKERSDANNTISILQANAESLPLGNDSVDAVVLRMALSQIPDAMQALNEVARIVRRGGHISIIDGEKNSGESFRAKVAAFVQSRKDLRIDFERVLPRLVMMRLLKA